MTRRLRFVAVSMVAALLGCESSGLSYRERGTQTMTGLTYATYSLPELAGGRQAAAPRFPLSLAVAQVGEVAPPEEFVKALAEKPTLFRTVQPVPGTAPAEASDSYAARHQKSGPPNLQEEQRRHVERMRRLAADLGASHLLLVGGTMDTTNEATGLSVFDITIVGAFIVPSRKIRGETRAAAALIDVPTGHVQLLSSATDGSSTMRSAVGQSDGQIALAQRLRDRVLGKLARQVIADCGQRFGTTSANAGS